MRTIFAVLCGMLAIAPAAARAKDTVRIAFVGPLTGGNSAIGLGGRNSADLAVKLRNQDAKAKYTYDLVVLDDECKPDTGVQVATKAGSDRSVVAGVTHYCSVVAMATVHGAYGLFMNWDGTQKGEGIEYHLLVLAMTTFLMIRGAGAFSVDRALTTAEPSRTAQP